MKKLYLTRREDFFNAIGHGQIPDGCVHEFGSIWMTLSLTENEFYNLFGNHPLIFERYLLKFSLQSILVVL